MFWKQFPERCFRELGDFFVVLASVLFLFLCVAVCIAAISSAIKVRKGDRVLFVLNGITAVVAVAAGVLALLFFIASVNIVKDFQSFDFSLTELKEITLRFFFPEMAFVFNGSGKEGIPLIVFLFITMMLALILTIISTIIMFVKYVKKHDLGKRARVLCILIFIGGGLSLGLLFITSGFEFIHDAGAVLGIVTAFLYISLVRIVGEKVKQLELEAPPKPAYDYGYSFGTEASVSDATVYQQMPQIPGQSAGGAFSTVPTDIGNHLYKTAPGPTLLIAKKGDKRLEVAAATMGKIIQAETVGGWEFIDMKNVVIRKKKGIIGMIIGYILGLFGFGSGIYEKGAYSTYVLIFRKEK